MYDDFLDTWTEEQVIDAIKEIVQTSRIASHGRYDLIDTVIAILSFRIVKDKDYYYLYSNLKEYSMKYNLYNEPVKGAIDRIEQLTKDIVYKLWGYYEFG